MRTHTMAGILLATLFALTACGGEKEEGEGKEAPEASSVATATAPDSAGLAEQTALAKDAKVSEADALAIALKVVPGGAVQQKELEREDGKLIYSIILKVAGKAGVEETNVDAITGKVVNKEHEDDPKPEPAKAPVTKKGG
jgi:uncharacterized membrane protein YkoI